MQTLAKYFTILTLTVAALATFSASVAVAEEPGRHPAYIQALEILRHARAHLQHGRADAGVKWDESLAVAEIDAAISEIKKASIDDGKDLSAHPAIDPTWAYGRRLHRSVELLHQAHDVLKEKEDDAYAHGLRARALKHIAAAAAYVDQGIIQVERH
jgi:hypothetical protein